MRPALADFRGTSTGVDWRLPVWRLALSLTVLSFLFFFFHLNVLVRVIVLMSVYYWGMRTLDREGGAARYGWWSGLWV